MAKYFEVMAQGPAKHVINLDQLNFIRASKDQVFVYINGAESALTVKMPYKEFLVELQNAIVSNLTIYSVVSESDPDWTSRPGPQVY